MEADVDDNTPLDKTNMIHPVDGSEIRRSPVDLVNMSIIYRVLYISGVGGRISSINSPSNVFFFPLAFCATSAAKPW